jgi:NDP-sugar pyrophosphorylase family protein
MKAMILAAGVGSRLDPLTRNVPKPMVPIVNRPVMEHIVELLKRHGFHEIMVNLHYLGDQIENYFGTVPSGACASITPKKTVCGEMRAASSDVNTSLMTLF